jgi:hypothetical protein
MASAAFPRPSRQPDFKLYHYQRVNSSRADGDDATLIDKIELSLGGGAGGE